VNRDGFADAVVMQSGWSGRAVREGRALLYLGTRAGLSRDPVWTGQGFRQPAPSPAEALASVT
jgi:hypothetical protein